MAAPPPCACSWSKAPRGAPVPTSWSCAATNGSPSPRRSRSPAWSGCWRRPPAPRPNFSPTPGNGTAPDRGAKGTLVRVGVATAGGDRTDRLAQLAAGPPQPGRWRTGLLSSLRAPEHDAGEAGAGGQVALDDCAVPGVGQRGGRAGAVRSPPLAQLAPPDHAVALSPRLPGLAAPAGTRTRPHHRDRRRGGKSAPARPPRSPNGRRWWRSACRKRDASWRWPFLGLCVPASAASTGRSGDDATKPAPGAATTAVASTAPSPLRLLPNLRL